MFSNRKATLKKTFFSPDILAAVAQRLEEQAKRTFIDLEDLIRFDS
jgi:hypothetical protein